MTFDLRRALLKKQEVETERLLAFEFKLRARTMRLLARALDADEAALVRRIVLADDSAILADLAATRGIAAEDAHRRWTECREAARRALVAEIGDPAPYRLA